MSVTAILQQLLVRRSLSREPPFVADALHLLGVIAMHSHLVFAPPDGEIVGTASEHSQTGRLWSRSEQVGRRKIAGAEPLSMAFEDSVVGDRFVSVAREND